MGCVARMEVIRNEHIIVFSNSEGEKKSLDRPGHRWENHIEIKINVDYSIGNMEWWCGPDSSGLVCELITDCCERDNDFSDFVETGTSRLAEQISASQEIVSPCSWFIEIWMQILLL